MIVDGRQTRAAGLVCWIDLIYVQCSPLSFSPGQVSLWPKEHIAGQDEMNRLEIRAQFINFGGLRFAFYSLGLRLSFLGFNQEGL